MNKEQFIFNELGIEIANLKIENAILKAQLRELQENEEEVTDENQND